MERKKRLAPWSVPAVAGLSALVLLTTLIYWAGLSGPFLFDDTTNILQNDTLRLDSLAPSELWRAAWSLESGPLKRPLAYLSFALDYYFAGGFDAFAFKATNLVIHLLNSLLVAALAWRLGAGALAEQPDRRRGFALLAAAIFALHPLALSPVLYVVQRMASLSTLFVLAAVLCLLRARTTFPVGAGHARDREAGPRHGTANPDTVAVAAMGRSYTPDPTHSSVGVGHARDRDVANVGRVSPAGVTRQATAGDRQTSGYAALTRPTGSWLAPMGWLLAGGLFALFGLFTKENAALLPLLYLLADRVCFAQAPYWRWLGRPGRGGQLTRGTLWLLAAAAAGLLAWYVAPGYAARPFTLTERVLTEGRVLWFYLGLFAVPRIDAFGLYHDDIALSTGLLAPWTTLPALLGLVALTWLGFSLLRRAPLVGFGLLWFLAGHLMESTLIPLEIAHEHRNYLPLVGLACASAWLLVDFYRRAPRPALAATGVVLVVLATTTALRASQWQDDYHFANYEVSHHPNSARARNYLAQALTNLGDLAGAEREAEVMVRLMPDEIGYRLNHANLVVAQGKALTPDQEARIESLLRSRKLSVFGTLTLKRYAGCIESNCKHLAPQLARWLEVYLASEQSKFDLSYAWYIKGLSLRSTGDTVGALNAFEKAFALDGGFLHPLFEQANIFMALGQWDNAAFDLERLREANQTAPVRQDKAIAELEAAIGKGRGGKEAVRILGDSADRKPEMP